MPEKWTGELVKKMHMNRVSATELAQQAGFTKAYVSMILNGSRHPRGAQETLETALTAIVQNRKNGGEGNV